MKKVKKIVLIIIGTIVFLWIVSVTAGVITYGGWNEYWDHLAKEREKSKLEKSKDDKTEQGEDAECCCCIPFEGVAGTCMETKKMTIKRCKSTGGHPLKNTSKCD